MDCPNCKKELSEKIKVSDVNIDRCSDCGGLWFEKDELRLAKDKKLPEAKWVDVEIKDKSIDWFKLSLWKDKFEFKAKEELKYCPVDKIPLYQVNYGDTSIEIDACGACHGIWLDKGEFKKIIDTTKSESQYEILNNYIKNLAQETKEIFIGPESVKSEIGDLLILIKLLKYKLMTQYPNLVKLFSNLPFTK